MQNPVIGMVLFPDATQLDFTAPFEVFARLPGATVHVLAHTLEPVRTDRGLMIVPTITYDACPKLDVLFLPGGPGQIAAEQDAQLMQLIARQANTILASVCTGSLLLGAAGLLRGRKATTHWAAMEALTILGAEAVDAPVVEDGNIVTGAGVSNGLDLALHLAEKLSGKDAAARIARGIEYPHASQHPDPAALARLSADLLAKNPYREIRLEAARKAAAKFQPTLHGRVD